MHSKCHYKIFLSVRSSYGNLSLFEIAGASAVLFSRKFQMRFSLLRRWDFFLIPLSITFLNPKIFGFLFCTKNSLTWGVKCEKKKKKKKKKKLKKIVGRLLYKLGKLYMNRTVIQVIENSRQ